VFLREMLLRRNRGRRERAAEEIRVLRQLPERRLEAFSKEWPLVSRNSIIAVRHNHYSVPSQLIGERVEVRIHSRHLEIWYSGEMVESLERLHGKGKAAINYRHVIHSLVRKPGAFAHYRYQASLFPRLVFRIAYDDLRQRAGAQAEREYLQLLKLAAEGSEERVADALRRLIDSGEMINSERVRELVRAENDGSLPQAPQVSITATPLESYDQLLDAEEVAA
jgi:hypothetical protein